MYVGNTYRKQWRLSSWSFTSNDRWQSWCLRRRFMKLDRIDSTSGTRNRNRRGERNRGRNSWRGMKIGLLRENVPLAGWMWQEIIETCSKQDIPSTNTLWTELGWLRVQFCTRQLSMALATLLTSLSLTTLLRTLSKIVDKLIQCHCHSTFIISRELYTYISTFITFCWECLHKIKGNKLNTKLFKHVKNNKLLEGNLDRLLDLQEGSFRGIKKNFLVTYPLV